MCGRAHLPVRGSPVEEQKLRRSQLPCVQLEQEQGWGQSSPSPSFLGPVPQSSFHLFEVMQVTVPVAQRVRGLKDPTPHLMLLCSCVPPCMRSKQQWIVV